MSKEYLGYVECCDLDEVCKEVKRQLRQGNQVEVYRLQATPVLFCVAAYADKVPVRWEDKDQRVVGYYQ